MASSIASLLIPAAIGRIADRGGDPHKAVSDLNRTLDRKACFYTTNVDVLMEVGQFQRSIAANSTTYGIYQVYISAIGHQTTEIGNLAWKFSRPVMMYTLREAPARETAAPEAAQPTH